MRLVYRDALASPIDAFSRRSVIVATRPPDQSCGGCQPTSTQRRRACMRRGVLSRRATTVARPTGVNPMICTPSSLQAKCSDQTCVRGLNSTVSCRVSGSCAVVWTPLALLHTEHANQRFSSTDGPPGRFRNDVLDMKRIADHDLLCLAIPAAQTGCSFDPLTKLTRYLGATHGNRLRIDGSDIS